MKKNKPFPFSSSRFRFSGQGAVFALLLFILFGNVFYLGYNSYEKNILRNSEKEGSIEKMVVIKKILEDKYLFADEVPPEQVIDGAIRGMTLAMGDIYTRYISEKEYEEFQVANSGHFGGIGVTVDSSADTSEGIIIQETIEGNSAEKAGLKPNDVIIEVDGQSIKGMPVSDAIALIKGEIGTNVTLKVKRDGEEEPMTVVLTRQSVEITTVGSAMIEDNIGYIKYVHFSETSIKQFDEAYKKLKEEGAKALILDLRDNPGGLVSVAVEILGRFVGGDKVAFITETKHGEEITKTTEPPYIVDIPVVVLINEQSASASEILAGALKDHNVAKIIGVTSFGKGLIQESYPLDEKSALIVTIAQYLTPNKTSIQNEGVKPDIEVQFEKEDLLKGIDTQIVKSIDYIKSTFK